MFTMVHAKHAAEVFITNWWFQIKNFTVCRPWRGGLTDRRTGWHTAAVTKRFSLSKTEPNMYSLISGTGFLHADIKIVGWRQLTTRQMVLSTRVAKRERTPGNWLVTPALLFKIYRPHSYFSGWRKPVSGRKCVLSVRSLISPVRNV